MRKVIRPINKNAVSPFDELILVMHLPNGTVRAVESGWGIEHMSRIKKLMEDHDRENGHESNYELIHKKQVEWVS